MEKTARQKFKVKTHFKIDFENPVTFAASDAAENH
jgi:hypothetical protein